MKNVLGYMATVSKIVFVHGDMLPIRLVLANASFVMVLSLLWDHTAFTRPAYSHLNEIGPQWVWVIMFLIHLIAEYVRLFDVRHRLWCALLTNIYGFMLWFIYTAGVTISIGQFAPTVAMDWSMVVASGWALFRTGRNSGIITE